MLSYSLDICLSDIFWITCFHFYLFIYIFNFFCLPFVVAVMSRGDTHLDVIIVVMFGVSGHCFLGCGAYQGSRSLIAVLTYSWPQCARDHTFCRGMGNPNGRLLDCVWHVGLGLCWD